MYEIHYDSVMVCQARDHRIEKMPSLVTDKLYWAP